MSAYAGIHLLDTPYSIDNVFDYYIPPELRDGISVGDFVTVPFGVSNRKRIGLVVSLKETPEDTKIDYKSVLGVCDKAMSLSEEALGLCLFLKEHTLCTVGDAAKAVVPTSAFSRMEEIVVVTGEGDTSKLEESTLLILKYITKHQSVPISTLKSKYGPSADPAIKKLVACGAIVKDITVKSTGEKYSVSYSLIVSRERAESIASGEDSGIKLRSYKHGEILRFLAKEGESVEESALISATNATKAQLKALCDKGLILREQTAVDRGLEAISFKQEYTELTLNDEQTSAYDRLCELADSGKPQGALLHGITGSGKTSVMLKTIDHILERGRGVIVLLPEIALTPQSLRIFCSRYGERVAIVHSALSLGERVDTFRRIKNGGADVVIGTRSAIFAPLSDVGLIIIDEEQEHTYKSDMNPKYHARDVARYRAAYHNSLMLLASATPSFESYKKALDGKYTLIELKNRYGAAKLPTAIIEDMRPELQSGNTSPLGAALCSRLLENKRDNNQSILFLNRRGYNNFLSCRTCGGAIKCPECSVSMTYHTTTSSYDTGYLACHWCGKRLPVPTVCPSCGGTHLARMGYGTQRVEQELGSLLPDATVLRMDTDTTTEKSSYEKLLGKFRRREADVLLGTQMVTKGHDFPDVTLVGVLLADASLYLDDYRAAERTFAMLTQVIGRAGRSEKNGVAVIQTNNPDNECIKFACAQDYRGFYESEIKLRKLLVFPPFCDIALLTLTCSNESELFRASKLLGEKVAEYLGTEYSDVPAVVYGPFEAPVYKVEGKFRMRMVLKIRSNKRSRAMLSDILKYFSASGAHGLSLSVDINPTNL
ncbi:MAG: primosomal protein N' [Ruminococcaceae bacterium]|nr:primosomal protein N' [Oscillospiraceae bacterium]